MIIPPFLDHAKEGNPKSDEKANSTFVFSKGTMSRELIPLSALDVTRDVMDITLVLKSDVELEDIEYFLEIKNWTTT